MNKDALIADLNRLSCGRVVANAFLSTLTTFGVGGPTKVLVEPETAAQASQVVAYCIKNSVPLWILGAGSNVIAPDEGLDGVVLRTTRLNKIRVSSTTLIAQAGVKDRLLAEAASQAELSGLEWLWDIPGTVGGAVYMNAGNNHGQTQETLLWAEWMDISGQIVRSTVEELELGYRTSLFRRIPSLILQACFIGKQKEREKIIQKMKLIQQERRRKFPTEKRCAGSIFKRPPGDYAGRLIEAAGCGGLTVGGAKVSQKHKGFIVNTGHATASDIVQLAKLVQHKVREYSGILLEMEVVMLGMDNCINAKVVPKD